MSPGGRNSVAGAFDGEPPFWCGDGELVLGGVVGAVVPREVVAPLVVGGEVDGLLVLEHALAAASSKAHPRTPSVLRLAIMADPLPVGTSSR
jgi:hypothetical protein